MSLYSTNNKDERIRPAFTFNNGLPLWANVLIVYVAGISFINLVLDITYRIADSPDNLANLSLIVFYLTKVLAIVLLTLIMFRNRTPFSYYLIAISLVGLMGYLTATIGIGSGSSVDTSSFLDIRSFYFYIGKLDVLPFYRYFPNNFAFIKADASIQRYIGIFEQVTLTALFISLAVKGRAKER